MRSGRAYVRAHAGDHFSRLFGLMWSLSIAAHVIFFVVFSVATTGTSKAENKPASRPLVFELADLPRGPGAGAVPPEKNQREALNPFQGKTKTTTDKLTENDMPENVKPNVNINRNTKWRSRQTQKEVKVEDKLRNSAIDRLKQQRQMVGGGGTGTGEGASIRDIYLGRVRKKITDTWHLPSGISAKDMERTAVVIIKIDSAGNLKEATIVNSSGHQAIDSSIQTAISRSTPFTRPPTELSEQASDGGFRFIFKAKEAK